MTTVGLFGSPEDQEIRALAARLGSRGAEPWIIDFAAYPRTLRITFDAHHVRVDGRDLREMGSAYLRRVGRNLPAHARYSECGEAMEPQAWSALHQPTVEAFARERQLQALRNAVLLSVARTRPMINPPVPTEPASPEAISVHALDARRATRPPVPCQLGRIANTKVRRRRMRTLEWCGRQALGGHLQDPALASR